MMQYNHAENIENDSWCAGCVADASKIQSEY